MGTVGWREATRRLCVAVEFLGVGRVNGWAVFGEKTLQLVARTTNYPLSLRTVRLTSSGLT